MRQIHRHIFWGFPRNILHNLATQVWLIRYHSMPVSSLSCSTLSPFCQMLPHLVCPVAASAGSCCCYWVYRIPLCLPNTPGAHQACGLPQLLRYQTLRSQDKCLSLQFSALLWWFQISATCASIAYRVLWTECLCFPKICMLKPDSNLMISQGEACGRWSGHEGEAPINEWY